MAMSPMMQEYCKTKEQYKDCILFYRLGDFYEMFFDDALLVTKELEITLTGKDCGLEERAPMCGVPYHAAETYINRLIERGHKVAICEQVEDPKKAKGLVKREVVRIVTPGTTLDAAALDETNPRHGGQPELLSQANPLRLHLDRHRHRPQRLGHGRRRHRNGRQRPRWL